MLKLCTFEVATHVGRCRRVGAFRDERIMDLNFATAWYMAQTGEPEPQQLADALVPAEMGAFLRAGLRALHTAEELFLGAGPHPVDWWKAAGEPPRGPNDETLVYSADQARLRAPLGDGPGPGDPVPGARVSRPGVAAVIGCGGIFGFTLRNEFEQIAATGPYIATRWTVGESPLHVIVRVNGTEVGRQVADSPEPHGAAGEMIFRPAGEWPVRAGDVVEVEVPLIGILRNRIT